MSPSTAKRVVLYQFGRYPIEAIVNPAAYLLDTHIELLSPAGALQMVEYSEVKALCFFSELLKTDLFQNHNLFERRPKVPGLWTRFTFRDSGKLDGILSHNLLEWPQPGYLVTPPRAGASRQRVFVPRAALAATELLGVVGRSAVAEKDARKRPGVPGEAQLSIFD